jgi:ABC-2 type transport system permease protein
MPDGSTTISSAPSATAGQSLASFLQSFWALYVLTLRQHLHGKRWIAMLALFMLPAAIAILVRSTARHPSSVLLEFMIGFMLIPQAVLPLIALLYASGVLFDEQEDQTITYLLVRPIPKWALYAFKMLATWTTTVVLTAVLTVLTYVAIYAHTDVPFADVALRCSKALAVHSLAIVAYCSLFGLISLLTARALVVGIIYTAVVEGVFANLPFGIRLATVIYYTRLITFRLMEFVISNSRSDADNLAAEAWQFDVGRDPKLLEHPSNAVCVLILLSASIVLTILAAWLCSRREFRVKVPGGQ